MQCGTWYTSGPRGWFRKAGARFSPALVDYLVSSTWLSAFERRAFMVKEIEKHERLRISPKSEGLIKRVMGPCAEPRVRWRIGRAKLDVCDFVEAMVIGTPFSVINVRGCAAFVTE